MGLVYERPQHVGRSVLVGQRERQHAVITPAEAARKRRQRHQLERGDAEIGEVAQVGNGGLEGTRLGERADVHLVEDVPRDPGRGEGRSLPLEAVRVDHLRVRLGALGLASRGRIGVALRASACEIGRASPRGE